MYFYSSNYEEKIVAEKKVTLGAVEDEPVNTLLFFKNHSIKEEIGQSSRMENENWRIT